MPYLQFHLMCLSSHLMCLSSIQYSWGGGDNNGPTYGICCSPSGYDDRHVKGFDCSGLTKYAIYQVKKISLAHYTCSQYNDSRGKKIAFSNAQPGDLIFYGSDSQKCNEHVAIYAGNGKMVEAEQHGVPLGTHTIRSGHAPYVVRFQADILEVQLENIQRFH